MRSTLTFISLSAVLSATALFGADSLGWRGDGTGRYPDATPPLKWGRTTQTIAALRYQAKKPEEKDQGLPAPDGVVREWLVLGPYAPPEPKPFEGDSMPDEVKLAPNEGDKVGELVWKKAEKLENAFIDFNTAFGKHKAGLGYAYTNVYADVPGEYLVNISCPDSVRLVVNGNPCKSIGGRFRAKFEKGWNHVLLKSKAAPHSWFVEPVFYPPTQADGSETNIAWHTPLPAYDADGFPPVAGSGMPILVGDKIFLLCEPHDLVCLNKADGKVLWSRSNSYFDTVPEADRAANPDIAALAPAAKELAALMDTLKSGPLDKAKLEQRNKLQGALAAGMLKVDPKKYRAPGGQDVGLAGVAPVSDGKFVYLWLLSGVSACYDLDGNRVWIKLENKPEIEHGFSSSPIVLDGMLITYMRELMARDVKTGEMIWHVQVSKELEGQSIAGHFHGSFVKATLGGQDYLVVPNGTVVRLKDGKLAFMDPKVTGFQHIPSAVMDGRTMLWQSTQGPLFIVTFPDKAADRLFPDALREVKIETNQFPMFYNDWHMSSPLVHEGLAYLMNNVGVLTVVDIAEAKVVYQRQLDIDGFVSHSEGACRGMGCSPTLAGKYIYLTGNNNTVLVIEPGRVFKQVAKNRIERPYLEWGWSNRQERTVACPIFDGKRLYLRAESGLYAIEEK